MSRWDAFGGPVCPEHARKLFDSFAFRFTEALAQPIENDVIDDLSLAVALRVVWREEPIGDLVLGAEGNNLPIGDVCPVVGYDGVQEAEATYEVLP